MRVALLGIAIMLAAEAPSWAGEASSPPRQPDPPPASPAAEVVDLDTLLARCGKISGLTARFVEEKQIALLSIPLRSEGTIHFARGRGLVRHATTPSKQSVLVTDRELVLWDGKATRRVTLGGGSAFETFVQTFSFLLAANRPALEERFAMSFGPRDGQPGWNLKLSPKNPDLKKLIQSIELSGQELQIATLTVREANGDVSTTRFSAVDVAKQYSAREVDQLFRVPPTP